MSDTDQIIALAANLYVGVAVAPDEDLSDDEVRRITALLEERFVATMGQEGSRYVIAEALHRILTAKDDLGVVLHETTKALGRLLQRDDLSGILSDLAGVARADGVVLSRERDFISTVARAWNLDAPVVSQSHETSSLPRDEWTPLHDLTLIFLVLAHGTDDDLSKNEVDLMIRKLEEWLPDLSSSRIREILRSAMNRYADGLDEAGIRRAIASVRDSMPAQQRMAALHDLIQIANADGVFLDVEEDLINNLLAEWEVDPYANYGRHGEKRGSVK